MDLEGFARELVVRVENEFDSVVIVDSGSVKGTGKSVFSMKLSQEICKIINYPYHKSGKYSFDLIVFNPTDEKIVDLVKNLPDGCVIHIDEASKVAYKRDFQKEYQKNLIKFVKICRKFKKIVILNDPDFWDLDKDLRNIADFRVIIVKRGLAQVKGKSTNPDLKDKWLRDKCIEVIETHTGNKKVFDLDSTRAGIKKTPNWLYDIPFGAMPKEEYQAYCELSKKEEVKSFKENVDAKNVRYQALVYTLLNNGEKARTLAKKVNITLKNSIYADKIEQYAIRDSSLWNIRNNWKSLATTNGD